MARLKFLLFQVTACLGVGGTMEERSYEHFGLLNDLRAAGFTCPGGNSYAPNDVPLKFDCRLWAAAQLHSQDMADNGYFSHTSQDGRSPWDRAEAQGIRANGENIAAGRSGAEAVLEQWKNSDGHCKNMMNPNFRVFAVGYAYNSGSRYRHYWTQMFKSSDVSDLDTSCYIPEATTSSSTTTTITTTTTTTATTTTTTTSTTVSTAATSANATDSNTTSIAAFVPTTNSTTFDGTAEANTSSTLATQSTTAPNPSTSVTSSMATADEVETSTSGSELQSTTGFETRPPGLLKGQIVVRTSHPGGFFASEQLQELVRAFLERLGDGLLQAISFAPAAEGRRLRRRLEESAAAATDVTVSFTAEVPAGRGEEAAAKLQAPPEVAQAALEAAAAEVSAADTIEAGALRQLGTGHQGETVRSAP
ncbi:ykwD [Symbiodinium sp. CCMP2592]|nr:ykwD [Symbiodinium sp. CCMP2592]